MIAHFKARILASAITMLVILNSNPAHAQTAIAPAPAAKADAATTQLDHISIQVVGSKGPAIFLIPGLSSPRAVWDGVVSELAKTHRVYLVQVNGFAGDEPRGNLKPGLLDGMVAELDGYIVSEKIKDAALVGHSMGGLVALMMAKAHPDHVSRAMIVDSLPYVGLIFNPGATVATMEPQAKMIRDQMAAGYGKPANAAFAEQTANGLALKPESRAKVKAWVMAADPRVSAEALYEDLITDLRPDLASITTPLTVVYAWSATLPKGRADAMFQGNFKAAPHVDYVPIGDTAHFVMLDQPDAFMTALNGFVDK
ncbi:alpha/beta hydrolase [Sphingomonas sp. So64.6b]|uniref:alpha/beta fold hydrolase n=1 Tax=Sphingomonas sp. So64.6b TaxID=2997354 RepID=UPI0015FF3D71|nr:alpha/beta hydrolase [Sphingomonas sp. So64.6b]QNA82682.1 alpha/beta hydrolase [Sphingomonas sp. So64.6b]